MNSPASTSSRSLFLLIGLLMLSSISWTTVQAQGSSVPSDKPAATIKSIVVGDKELTEVTTTEATVTRAAGGEVLAASAGTLLFKGDVIQTFGETRVTLLFFDAPFPERDNEVIVKENSKVGISSTNSWWGKIWVKVKGAFNSNSTYVRLGATGTEYEFSVDEVSQNATVVVLEGAVKYLEGQFSLVQTGLTENATARVNDSPFALLRNFAHAVSPQVQSGMSIDVPAGQVLDFSGTYHVLNDCRQTHYFEFRTSNADWLKLVVQARAAVPPRVSLPVTATLRFDAKRLSPGQYRANVYAICVDCNKEPKCTQSQLDWPINLTVNSSGPGPRPSPSPSPLPSPSANGLGGTQSGEVAQLQDMVFTKNVDQPTQATENRVVSVLDWTNQVLLTSQPTYSTQNIIPHFPTVDVRSRNFVRARQNAVLKQDPRANQVLGNVYSDWGQGALAVSAYDKANGGGAETQLTIDRAEAYRLTGQLRKAEASLNALQSTERQSVRALNAAGNLSLAYAQVAADTGKASDAATHLENAKASYSGALQSMPSARQAGTISPELTTRSNLGEAYVEAGKLAQTRSDLTKAKEEFLKGQEALEPIQQANSIYPFAVTNLGRAYQGLGNVAHLSGNETEAQGAYQRAERIQRQAINAHPDFAEAYFNLGDLFDDQGKKEAAKENYWRAIKSRPEQPDSYYPLAVLVQPENRALAAALAATYLQLEPDVFKQGEKARDAASIAERRDARPRPRPFESKPVTDSDTRTETEKDIEPKSGTVPDLLNKTSAQALSAIQTAGYVLGKVDKKGSNSADFVISQSPAAGTSAAKGSLINLVMDRGIEVPDVIDDKEGTAVRKLTKDRPFKMGSITYKTVCKNVDEVIEQYPPKHTRAAPGTVVNIVMGSVGEDPTIIPDLSDRSRADAEAKLRQMGLRFRRPQTEESDAREGTVIRQRPDAGRRYAKICPVDEVQMTLAIPWIIVEDYVNSTLDEARRRVRSIDLIESVSYRPSTDYPAGKVISQSPSPGSKAKHRSTVNLLVATTLPGTTVQQPPPQEPRMPSVMGWEFDSAKRYLEQLGFKVTLECHDVSRYPNNKPGTVAAQSPAADSPINGKPPVTLKYVVNSCGPILLNRGRARPIWSVIP